MPVSYTQLVPNDAALLRSVSCAVNQLRASIEASNRIETSVIAPALPYTIPDFIYHSYTIITTGSVSLDGVAVPAGAYSFGGGVNDLVDGTVITGGGSVVITTQKKL